MDEGDEIDVLIKELLGFPVLEFEHLQQILGVVAVAAVFRLVNQEHRVVARSEHVESGRAERLCPVTRMRDIDPAQELVRLGTAGNRCAGHHCYDES